MAAPVSARRPRWTALEIRPIAPPPCAPPPTTPDGPVHLVEQYAKAGLRSPLDTGDGPNPAS